MDNTINNVSFKANLITLSKIKNKSAFTEIKQIFKNSTEKSKQDALYISDTSLGENLLQLSHKNNGEYSDYKNADIAIRNINEQIEAMGSKEFAKKLVAIFNALKSHEKAYAIINDFKSEIKRNNSLLTINNRIKEVWASEGKNHISKRYEVLAEKNIERIEILTDKLKEYINKYNKKIDTLSAKYKEIEKLKF